MVGFVGMSHLGVVSGICAASKGHEVLLVDSDCTLMDEISNSRLPVHEPQLDECFAQSRERIAFSSDLSTLSNCSLVYIARDVPTDGQNRGDRQVVREMLCQVIAAVSPGTVVVVLSQLNPGFMRSFVAAESESIKSKSLRLIYQVETLIFGRAVERALHPERYIVGCEFPNEPLPKVLLEYLESYDCPIVPMRFESAELAKISINLFLISSISTTNTIAEVCESIGADWEEIAEVLRLDRRIGPYAYLKPGLGIAGGNLERDVQSILDLCAEHGTDSGVVNSWVSNLNYRKDWVVRALYRNVFTHVENPTIALWGLAYKQDTHSTKNSASLQLIETLKGCHKRVYDPCARLAKSYRDTTWADSALAALEEADALVVITPWPEFSQISMSEIRSRMKGNVILDPYRLLDAGFLENDSFSYHALGIH